MGRVNIIESGSDVTIGLNGNTGNISAGRNGEGGELILLPASVVGNNFEVTQAKCHIDGENSQMYLGGNGTGGDVLLYSANAPNNHDRSGTTILLSGTRGNIWAGGNGQGGDFALLPADVVGNTFQFTRASYHVDGENAQMYLGGNNRNGDILLYSANAPNNHDRSGTTILLSGTRGNIWAGGNGQGGDLVLLPADVVGNNFDFTRARVHIDGEGADMWIGGNNRNGEIMIFPEDAGNNHDRNLASIYLNGLSGDIILRNADCAEEFDISVSESEIEPGTVMTLDREGNLQQSKEAYDKKVAGVISGAGDYKPGIVLDRQYSQKKRMPLALVGKVYCKVDARYSSIEVGDLLTTSDTPGHAMKADDPLKAFGAVIGKALRPMKEGSGLIPILIALQ